MEAKIEMSLKDFEVLKFKAEEFDKIIDSPNNGVLFYLTTGWKNEYIKVINQDEFTFEMESEIRNLKRTIEKLNDQIKSTLSRSDKWWSGIWK